MSVDIERITECVVNCYNCYAPLPTLLAASLWVLWLVSSTVVLVAVLVHLVICAILVPLSGRGLADRQHAWSAATDLRIKLLSSVVKSLQYIKLAALEAFVARAAADTREVEIRKRTHLCLQDMSVCLLANVVGQSLVIVAVV